jgi:hypothetical protein
VVLDEFHVLERRARPVRERHAVARVDRRVGRERKHLAAAAGAEDDRARGDRLDAAGGEIDGDDALHAPLVHEEPGHEPFVVALDRRVLERGLKQRVQHVEAGPVGGKPRAHVLHPAEGAHGDAAIRLAAPRAAPVLHAEQLPRRLLHEHLDGLLVAEPVATGNRVVRVLVEAVVGGNRARGASFGGDRVAPHRINLGHDRDVEAWIEFGDGNSGAQTGAAAAHQHNVMSRDHVVLLRRPGSILRCAEAALWNRCYSAERSSSTMTRPSWCTTLRLTLPS